MDETDNRNLEELLDAVVGEPAGACDHEGISQGREGWDADDISFLQAVDIATNMKFATQPDVEKEWEAFAARGGKYGSAKRIWIGVLSAVAAVVALVVMTFTLVVDRDGESHIAATENLVETTDEDFHVEKVATQPLPAETSKMLVVRTGLREMTTVTLSDGSEVTLNANSELSCPERFVGGVRQVRLKGEAYFKVAHDSSCPFLLRSGNVTTKVLGTEFNVRGYNPADTHVTLVNGKIEVLALNRRTVVSPNHDVHISENGLEVTEVNTRDFTSWRQGILYFDDATLHAILQQIGNWYGVNVVCREETLLSKRYHYMFHTTDSLEDVLDYIRQSSEVEINLKGNTIYVE